MSKKFDNNVLDLIKQKGFYPYEYMSIFEKFKEHFPSKEEIYSSLAGKKNSDKENDHVLKDWNKFEMKKMKDYHDLYLKCDVLLLAGEFGKFRNNSLKNYGLCSSHYVSAPALIWDAMLNMTKVELEHISDNDMHKFYEKGMTGGVSYIPNRYSKVNNKYLKSYDPKQKLKHILHLDTKNLYGYAMSNFFQQMDSNG